MKKFLSDHSQRLCEGPLKKCCHPEKVNKISPLCWTGDRGSKAVTYAVIARTSLQGSYAKKGDRVTAIKSISFIIGLFKVFVKREKGLLRDLNRERLSPCHPFVLSRPSEPSYAVTAFLPMLSPFALRSR